MVWIFQKIQKTVVHSLKLFLGLTVLALAPAFLILMTSFTRIIIVLTFIRQALGTAQLPPNQLLMGLALFLTFFIMSPFLERVNSEALQPYLKGKITQDLAIEKGLLPFREFMFKQTRLKDLSLFSTIRGKEASTQLEQTPTSILIPAFVLSELKTAFQIGFIIYLPFIVIDILVASSLMAMGMMMFPPLVISLPLKVMLFVFVDGWSLLVGSLVKSFS